MPIGEIARARDIPVQFLEGLFATLRRAGILQSQRGVKGGYSFARPPSEITVLEVVELLEGELGADAAGQRPRLDGRGRSRQEACSAERRSPRWPSARRRRRRADVLHLKGGQMQSEIPHVEPNWTPTDPISTPESELNSAATPPHPVAGGPLGLAATPAR